MRQKLPKQKREETSNADKQAQADAAAKLEAEALKSQTVKHQALLQVRKAVALNLQVQLVHPNRHQRQNHRQANHQHQELALVVCFRWNQPLILGAKLVQVI